MTYTVADIRKVVDNFAADFSMMSQATGLHTRESVASIVSDLKIFAEHSYLVEVTLILYDKAGNKIRAAVYKVAQAATGWVTDRPGNNLWPRTEGGILYVLGTLTNSWAAKTEAERLVFIRDRGLNHPWGATDKDTSLSALASSAGQKYASNGYGWQRTNYGQ